MASATQMAEAEGLLEDGGAEASVVWLVNCRRFTALEHVYSIFGPVI